MQPFCDGSGLLVGTGLRAGTLVHWGPKGPSSCWGVTVSGCVQAWPPVEEGPPFKPELAPGGSP